MSDKKGYIEVKSFYEWVEWEGCGLLEWLKDDDEMWKCLSPEHRKFVVEVSELCDRYKRFVDAGKPVQVLEDARYAIEVRCEKDQAIFEGYFPYGYGWRRVTASSKSSTLTADSTVSLDKLVLYDVEAESICHNCFRGSGM